MDCHELFNAAVRENVAFVPGDCFYASDDLEARRHFRLNFSYSRPEAIREGIRRLAIAVRQQMEALHFASATA
jgi:2-aminoadipate transaminase